MGNRRKMLRGLNLSQPQMTDPSLWLFPPQGYDTCMRSKSARWKGREAPAGGDSSIAEAVNALQIFDTARPELAACHSTNCGKMRRAEQPTTINPHLNAQGVLLGRLFRTRRGVHFLGHCLGLARCKVAFGVTVTVLGLRFRRLRGVTLFCLRT